MTTAQQYFDALMKGDREMVTTFVGNNLDEGVPPLEILNTGLIPGMERLGQKFRAAEIYIPEVLMAARAMHAGLDILRPKIAETGAKPAGKIVIGTVKGDLHDIGKNMLKALLKGNGFEVVDIGVDNSPASFIEAIKKHRPEVVGYSGLLTTTLAGIPKQIEALKKEGLRDRVITIVGGAPVTEAFARRNGVDLYGKDANHGVLVIEKALSKRKINT